MGAEAAEDIEILTSYVEHVSMSDEAKEKAPSWRQVLPAAELRSCGIFCVVGVK